MRARLLVGLEAGLVPLEERHKSNLSEFESVELAGAARDDFESAEATIDIPR